MTADSNLFQEQPRKDCLPLYEGKMMHQFDHLWQQPQSGPRYWVDKKEGRAKILGRTKDQGQVLPYQTYRLGFRNIASNTNERTMIMTMLPPYVFVGHSLPLCEVQPYDHQTMIFFCAVMNSFIVDWLIRMKVSANLSFVFLDQTPVPRLTAQDKRFAPIVERAARLICVHPDFNGLAKDLGLKAHQPLDADERRTLRAELDVLIARLYGLTRDELAHILRAFPLVDEGIKTDILNSWD